MELNSYLLFDGHCEEAFKFYERALGGKKLELMRMSEVPASNQMPGSNPNHIMHARIRIGDGSLMGNDVPKEHYKRPQGFHVSLSVETPAEAERIFAELAKGGEISMQITETFWAQRFGMVTDKFGVPWMVNCNKPM